MQLKHLILIGFGILLGIAGTGFLDSTHSKANLDSSGATWCNVPASEAAFSCSMHSNVKLGEPGSCPVCGMDLVDIHTSSYFNPDLIPLDPWQVRQMQIKTEKVTIGSGQNISLQLAGKLEIDQSRIFHQVCHLPGRIEQMYVTKEGEIVKKGQPIASVYSKELIASLETYHFNKHAESLARSAFNSLKSWKIPESFFMSVDMTGDYHKPVNVYADFGGVVLKKQAEAGDYAVSTHMGHPTILYELADLSVLWAELDVYEKDLSTIQMGASVELSVQAFPGENWKGVVDHIGDQIDPQSQTFKLRVLVTNSENRLKPGMLANAVLKIPVSNNSGLFIPKSAVLWTGKRSVVYKRETEFSQDVFSYCEVETGRDVGDLIEVISGLEEDDEIVSQGTFVLDANAQLQGRRSMMNQPGRDGNNPDLVIANQ